MSDDIKKDRSPFYPKTTLADAIDVVKRLHAKTGKAQVRREVAVQALGYSGLNGAALGTLGTLSQYGLIDRQRGEGMSVSPLAVKLIHPLSPSQEAESRLEAALKPRVFNEIFTGGHHACSEDVLANQLIQNGFTPDGAKRAASVYKANAEFANLTSSSMILADTGQDNTLEMKASPQPTTISAKAYVGPVPTFSLAPSNKKEYRVPLGSGEALIIITGDSLPTPDDFEALKEFADFCKQQAERKLAVQSEAVNPIAGKKPSELLPPT